MQTSKSMVLRGGDVHNSPLYTMANGRESKGLSAKVILCSPAVFNLQLWSTRPHVQGVRTYLYCMSRVQDLQPVQASKSMVMVEGS